MRMSVPAIAAALLLSTAAGPAPADAAGVADDVQATIDAMTGAFARGDVGGILATYEPGAVVVGEPGAPIAGTAALTAMFQQFVALEPQFTFMDHEVIEAGDIALHLSTWKMEGRTPDGFAGRAERSLGGRPSPAARRPVADGDRRSVRGSHPRPVTKYRREPGRRRARWPRSAPARPSGRVPPLSSGNGRACTGLPSAPRCIWTACRRAR